MDEKLTYGDIRKELLAQQIWNTTYGTAAVNAKPSPNRPLEDFADWALVMELLSRGYAVAKLPVEELAEEVAK